MGLFSKIAEFLSGPITTVLETRKIKKEAEMKMLAQVAEAEAERKIAVIKSETKIAEKKADADVNWENIWATQAQSSWKDEYWTILLSLPVISAFIPPLQLYITEGFVIIGTMPDWYMTAVLSAIGAAFGLRALTKFTNKKGK